MISKWSNLILFAHLEGFNNYFSIQVQSIDIKFNNVFKRLNLFCDQFQKYYFSCFFWYDVLK